MRLIDADALLEAIAARTTTINSKNINKNEMLDLITNATTAEREGWVSVPIEPDNTMIYAGAENLDSFSPVAAICIYKAMLSAAPKE
jgi:hypothetical protein